MKRVSNFRDYVKINEYNSEPSEPSNMDKEIFWKFVRIADWKSDHDYERIKKLLKSKFRESYINKLQSVYDYYLNELSHRFESDWLGEPGIPVGEDSWIDLRGDVIGRGEEFYKSITVEKLRKMAIEDDYKECFGYSFNNI